MAINQEVMEATLNKTGSMHQATKFSKIFIDRCALYQKPVLDIGCAYGVTTIPALKNGATVIANDIDDKHLEILTERTPKQLLKNLICINGKFPYDIHFQPHSLSCVHMSLVLSFLNGEDISHGFKKINNWLEYNGDLIIVNYTPFIKMLEGFIPQYQKNKRDGLLWPGFIRDITLYTKQNYYIHNLPKCIHHFDLETIARELDQAGFTIEIAEYFTIDNLPKEYKLDGHEFLGFIGKKRKEAFE